MMLNLYDVLSAVGQQTTLQVTVGELQTRFYGEEIRVLCKDSFDVELKHLQKDTLLISFEVDVEAVRTCSRCLGNVDCEYHLNVFRNINLATMEAYADDASDADKISYIEDCNLDIDMLVLDELYTVLPMNVVCKDDCQGICKVCGTNLNESTCNCDQTVPDPRMAVFSDIFNQFKEV